MSKLVHVNLLLLWSFCQVGCQSQPIVEPITLEDPILWQSQDLGTSSPASFPIPRLIKKEQATNSSGEVVEIRRLWDVNHDGRANLLTVYDHEDRIIHSVFDLDLDGIPDQIETRGHR